MIIQLIEKWPEFKVMYEEIYNQCRSIEGVMNMFSKELQELDRNTVQYMIDELQEEIDKAVKELDEKKQELDERSQELDERSQELNEKKQELNEKNQELERERQEKVSAYERIRELEALLQKKERGQ